MHPLSITVFYFVQQDIFIYFTNSGFLITCLFCVPLDFITPVFLYPASVPLSCL